MVLPGCVSLNSFQEQGAVSLQGLRGPVTVMRDENGMAYIHADTIDDFLRMDSSAPRTACSRWS
jgi:acyl-homoserine lactone acylase PvdQ